MTKLLKIESVDEIEALAEAAGRTFDRFTNEIKAILTTERCVYVRKLRVVEDYSWREIALTCHNTWECTWMPPSNQIVGMALCMLAALAHGEDYMAWPWN